MGALRQERDLFAFCEGGKKKLKSWSLGERERHPCSVAKKGSENFWGWLGVVRAVAFSLSHGLINVLVNPWGGRLAA